jgi:F-type H+-transporting ATPase subunit delta
MNESKIAVRYAKALFELVKEDHALEVHQEEMVSLYQCIREIPELKMIIESPVIRASEKMKLFREAFGSSFSGTTMKFIDMVLEGRREEHLAGICRYFLDLIKKEKGIRSAELVTAFKADDKLKQSIIRLVSKRFGGQVELHEKTDTSLIGGFILRVGDQQIDASISSKLEKIKNELTNS